MIDALRPFISRLVGIALVWLLEHFLVGFVVDDASKAQAVDFITNTVCTLLAGFVTTHKTLDKWINAGDTASSHLATEQNLKAEQLKRNLR